MSEMRYDLSFTGIQLGYGLALVLVVLGTVMINQPLVASEEYTVKRPVPTPESWLAASQHPRLVCTPEQLQEARLTVRGTTWGRAYFLRQQERAERFINMSEQELRDLVPPPDSTYIKGLGMNLDPVHGKRMQWAGWDDPHAMVDVEGRRYPNDQWPDAGHLPEYLEAVPFPAHASDDRHFFEALAYARVMDALETVALPALADVYALSGSEQHARAAVVLLDAIATIYPTNERGPFDYPAGSGRLDRPIYQVARGLENYAVTIDLIASSGLLEQPSSTNPGLSVRENIAKNLLWNGGAYCYYWARRHEGRLLGNGEADYNKGAGIVAAMLGERDLAYPLIEGKSSLFAMLEINVDRSGIYYETAPSYEDYTRNLYISSAEVIEAMRRAGWTDVPSAYSHPNMLSLLNEPFNRREVGGHIPHIGEDSIPDRDQYDPMRRRPDRPAVFQDRYLQGQIDAAWVRFVRGLDKEAAAQLLADTFHEVEIKPSVETRPSHPSGDRWSVYHITRHHLKQLKDIESDPTRFETRSVFYGGEGLALLRGGRSSHRHGAQLLFGPFKHKSQEEALSWTFFARGAEWSYDPGKANAHYRMGFTIQSVAHQQVVVNQSSIGRSGGIGHLRSVHDTPSVQWAMGSHPDAYAHHGVTRFERLIAQAQTDPDGELGYWLDVSRVMGGETRDDSFHSQMAEVSLENITLPEPSANRPSLYGDQDYGRLIRADWRLEGYNDKPFYWAPEGDGYGFLGNPVQIDMPDQVRLIGANPIYAKEACVLITDMIGAPDRQLIVADGPGYGVQDRRLPVSVPYILQRDEGQRPSVFAKLIRLADTVEDDAIESFEQLEVQINKRGVDQELTKIVGAWLVTWKDGRKDLWVFGDDEASPAMTVNAKGLSTVRTDAHVAFIRFNADGEAVMIEASTATHLEIEGGPALQGRSALKGVVTQIDPNVTPATLHVSWGHAPDSDHALPTGALVLTTPEVGQPTTWRLDSLEDSRLIMEGTTPAFGVTELIAEPDKAGWYRSQTLLSRLRNLGHAGSNSYLIGRPVYTTDGAFVGRIAEAGGNFLAPMRLEFVDDHKPEETYSAYIMEAAEGDTVRIPLHLSWYR